MFGRWRAPTTTPILSGRSRSGEQRVDLHLLELFGDRVLKEEEHEISVKHVLLPKANFQELDGENSSQESFPFSK